jgi:cytochrome P450
MKNAVNELLRFRTPPKFVNRYLLEDVELGGQLFRKGDTLLLCSAAAESDPSQFDEPDKLDITRDVSQALTFGHGPHYCVGTHMARTELRFVLEFILDRLPEDIAVVEEGVTFNSGNPLTFEIKNLPLDTRL